MNSTGSSAETDMSEQARRQSNLDRVEAFFRSQPGIWIHARDFEAVGGRQAWRSRIAECRTRRGMHIENRQDRVADGRVVASWYRFMAFTPLGRDASDYTETLPLPLFEGAPR